MESLEEQSRTGRITKSDYDNIKKKNLKKLQSIETDLEKEWRKIETVAGRAEASESVPSPPEPEISHDVPKEEPKKEETPEEEKKEDAPKEDAKSETDQKKLDVSKTETKEDEKPNS